MGIHGPSTVPMIFLPHAVQLVSLDCLIEILLKCRGSHNRAHLKHVIMYIYSCGLEDHRIVGNYFVPILAEHGNSVEAEKTFRRLSHRNEHSWTSLMQICVEDGKSSHSLYLFEKMRDDGVSPSKHTFVAVLKACAKLKAIEKGQELYMEIAQEGLELDFCIGSILVDMYAKCGFLLEAQEIFDELPIKDSVTWTALISGYTENGHTLAALKLLRQMQENGLPLDATTFVCCLKVGCGDREGPDIVEEIHHELVKYGFEHEIIVANSLVDAYCKSGSLVEASAVLKKMQVKDIISWTSLISGFAEYGCTEEALACYERIQEEGMLPNKVTLVCSLRACGSVNTAKQGAEMHSVIFKRGLEKEPSISSALVAMYGRCQLLIEAHNILQRLEGEDVVPWNALLSGYTSHGLVDEAMEAFERMRTKGVHPDNVTFICSLKACCGEKAIGSVRHLHMETVKHGYESELTVGNVLVDSYVKSGSLVEARQVFDSLKVQDVVSWTSLIAGYAFRGMSKAVFHLFEKMGEQGICPDAVVLQSVLTACDHSGLVDMGRAYFEAISREYGKTPTISHHNAMVDILARAGRFEEVVEMLEKMPLQPDQVTWLSVLSACRKWGNVKLAEKAFANAAKLDEEDDAAFLLMCNIYLDAEMWADCQEH